MAITKKKKKIRDVVGNVEKIDHFSTLWVGKWTVIIENNMGFLKNFSYIMKGHLPYDPHLVILDKTS